MSASRRFYQQYRKRQEYRPQYVRKERIYICHHNIQQRRGMKKCQPEQSFAKLLDCEEQRNGSEGQLALKARRFKSQDTEPYQHGTGRKTCRRCKTHLVYSSNLIFKPATWSHPWSCSEPLQVVINLLRSSGVFSAIVFTCSRAFFTCRTVAEDSPVSSTREINSERIWLTSAIRSITSARARAP